MNTTMQSIETDRIYYDGFERVEALHYADGSVTKQVEEFTGGEFEQDGGDWEHGVAEYAGVSFDDGRGKDDAWVNPGQWAIRRADGSIGVSDDEPVHVEWWTYGIWVEEVSAFTTMPGAKEDTTHRKPVLSNGWVGPWEEVPS